MVHRLSMPKGTCRPTPGHPQHPPASLLFFSVPKVWRGPRQQPRWAGISTLPWAGAHPTGLWQWLGAATILLCPGAGWPWEQGEARKQEQALPEPAAAGELPRPQTNTGMPGSGAWAGCLQLHPGTWDSHPTNSVGVGTPACSRLLSAQWSLQHQMHLPRCNWMLQNNCSKWAPLPSRIHTNVNKTGKYKVASWLVSLGRVIRFYNNLFRDVKEL